MKKAQLTIALLAATLVAVVVLVVPVAPTAIADDEQGGVVVIRDDCDPNDATWGAVGGCFRKKGDVTRAEFGSELISPKAASVVGHQAWRFDPTYVEVNGGHDFLIARNRGGRVHTFTRVAQFGGGKTANPALNFGLTQAPECLTSTDIEPGGGEVVHGLTPGNHHFQCCFHPWMRTTVKVHEH